LGVLTYTYMRTNRAYYCLLDGQALETVLYPGDWEAV
jgi:hypothetical protein